MQALWWCRLCDYLRVQWKTYRTFFIWLLVFFVVGAVLGIVTIVICNVAVDEINYELIDGNILNATSTGVIGQMDSFNYFSFGFDAWLLV